ncbi:MAG TPA: DNA mismatch repair protein MutS [Firmicutes bacterium]|nr:DNA mismatch repair protein MutS [Bacillota bacterium]
MDETPVYQQYLEEKAKFPQALLLFRLGDFYELFGEDAQVASRVLELTLTSREIGKGRRIPMCGVPYHAVDHYLARLVDEGYAVAICEQMEDPRHAKGLVKRQVTRVVTPGTRLDPASLDERRPNFLVAVATAASSPSRVWVEPLGLACVDISTGDFFGTEVSSAAALQTELLRLEPAEILVDPALAADPFWETIGRLLARVRFTTGEVRSFLPEPAAERLREQFGTLSLAPFGLEGKRALISAAGAVLEYVQETQQSSLTHLRSFRSYSLADQLLIDPVSQRNLEIFRSLRDGSRKGTLWEVLDRTVTPMGARLLRSWLENPLVQVEPIRQRLGAVRFLVQKTLVRNEIREILNQIRDLERLTARVACGAANARDLLALGRSLTPLPLLRRALAGALEEAGQAGTGSGGNAPPQLLVELLSSFDTVEDVANRILRALSDEPPVQLKEGGLIREGVDLELDRLRQSSREAQEWIAALEGRERERTGIKSLKVGFNKVFGYYIEVTRPNLGQVPSDYIRKQTLAGGERFITPELKEKEELVLGAQERMAEREYELFLALRQEVAEQAPRLLAAARVVATVDVLASLAQVAVTRQYVEPEVDGGDEIRIEGGRHPVVETVIPGGRFVPNDTLLNNRERQIVILTGPNMAGKSTYLRQVALIVLLAQIGSFVPAKSARIGLVDRIFTRVGASDNLASGESTFMVEMNEVSYILRHATPKSLVILDEVGRGTSTFDGVSLAWAVTEYLHEEPQCRAKTLFATHYHELTQLASFLPRVVNMSVAVEKTAGGIVFLRRIQPGGADESYGIEVARLAGLPEAVLRRASEILAELEGSSPGRVRSGPPPAGASSRPAGVSPASAGISPSPGELGRPGVLAAAGVAAAPAGTSSGRVPAPRTAGAAIRAYQLQLFTPPPHPALVELARLDVNALTPIAALNVLARLKELLTAEPPAGLEAVLREGATNHHLGEQERA